MHIHHFGSFSLLSTNFNNMMMAISYTRLSFSPTHSVNLNPQLLPKIRTMFLLCKFWVGSLSPANGSVKSRSQKWSLNVGFTEPQWCGCIEDTLVKPLNRELPRREPQHQKNERVQAKTISTTETYKIGLKKSHLE